MRNIVFLILLLLSGCYGTFRTAEVLEPGRQAIDVNCVGWAVEGGSTYPGQKYIGFFPTLHYRRGTKELEWGIKLYTWGTEPTLCLPLVKDAIALEMGIGTFAYMPGFGEMNLIASKHLKPFNIYGSGKLIIGAPEERKSFVLERLLGGLNIGIFFLEVSYGDYYWFDIEGPGEVLHGSTVYGIGIRAFSWGGNKTKVQEKDNLELKQ